MSRRTSINIVGGFT